MKFSSLTLLFALALALAPQAAAQTKTVGAQGVTRVEKKVETQRTTTTATDEDFAVERRVDAAPDVVLSLCLESGDVVVRGWARGEVRARLEETNGLRLDAGGGQPARRVEVMVFPNKETEYESGGCGSTSRLELMVPRGASVTVQARSGHVEVADVADIHIQSLSGDVDVRRASKSVEVSCLSGDISLADSSGPVRLAAISGSVEARNVRTVAQGDSFEAKSTSGDVSLEGVTHSQVGGATISGNVLYEGALARGGVYDFRTISGDVTMELPPDSSFTLHAKVVVSGDIVTDFPVKTSASASASSSASSSASAPGNPPVGPTGPVNAPLPPLPPDMKKPGKMKPPKEPAQTRLDGTVGTGDGSLHLRRQ
ncbi:MAG: hypothetical protein DMF65_13370 [Acidobacteria bacterium]|nr:MAG: hypothetical protein DMF65_13370 [Acidobacteriota bacterium]